VSKKTLVLTGANGQLGKSIQKLWDAAPIHDCFHLLAFDKQQLDITDRESLQQQLNNLKVDVIINAAAYTAVDAAQESEANAELAYAINAHGPKNLARWAQAADAKLIHISTDFVFDGTATSPYPIDAQPNPRGVYAASKLAGEQAVLEALPNKAIVLRVSWLYSEYNSNFVKTMLGLLATRESIAVVSDQIGAPTSAGSLGEVLFNIAVSDNGNGIYHWSDDGSISWYDFAVAIQEEGIAAGLVAHSVPINPITTDEYPTVAARPAYSVLDRSRTEADFTCTAPPWREQLKLVIQHLADREQTH